MRSRLNRTLAFGLLIVGGLASIARAESLEAPDTLYRNGIGAFSSGNYADAAAAFQEILTRFGTEPSMEKEMESVVYALGCSYYNIGKYPEAVTAFEEYAKKFPQARFLDEALFRIAAAHQAQENYSAAVAAYQRLVQDMPRSPFAEDAAFQIGICRMIEGSTKETAAVFHSFQQGFPDSELSAQAAVFEARCLFETDQLTAALDALDTRQGKGQQFDHVVYANFLAMEIGDAAYEGTDYDTALRAYRRVRTRDSLLHMQRRSLAGIRNDLIAMTREATTPQTIRERFRTERRLRSRITQGQDLLSKLESMPNYDDGLFHRIGRCFMNLDRFWEARVAFGRVAEEAQDKKIREAAHFDLVLVIGRLRQFADVIAEADRYLARYGSDEEHRKNGHVPTIAFLRAEAYVNQELFEEAEPELKRLLEDYPGHNQKPRIEFYIALCAAMQERFAESIDLFTSWQKAYPGNPLNAEVEYWLPIAMYYHGNYADALPLFTDFAARYPLAVYAPEAEYRAALCRYALEDFKGCALALGGWIEKHPDHVFKWEAQVTRADALAAAGMLDPAKENYLRVTKEAGPFYFLALTQLAKVYKALATDDDFREMANSFIRYIREEPDSGNVIHAAYQAGWALKQIGRTDDARKLYWNTIERYGDRREWEGFDPLLKDLETLYRELPADTFAEELNTRYRAAVDSQKTRLASRLKLVQIQMMPAEKIPAEADRFLVQFKPDALSPEALAFLGELYLGQGKPEAAMPLFRKILDAFPASRQRALAYARLAAQYAQRKEFEPAYSNAVLATSEAGDPVLLMQATFTLGQSLFGLQRYADAEEAFTSVLASRASPRELKPEALLGIGASLEAQGEPRKAIPYYQRIFVMYQAYTDAVAAAYLRSGEAFEKLKDREAAIRTYREMLDSESGQNTPQADEARRRLARLES